MLYQLEMSETEGLIVTNCRRDGLPLPERVANAPQPRMGLEFYFVAYVELSSGRPYIGMSGAPGPIPWHHIHQYAALNGFSPRQTSRLEALCRKMDEAYLRWWEKKNGGKPRA